MKVKHPAFKYSLIALLVGASSSSFASAFMLEEQNAVQTGDFGAGGAAIAEDASTAWFNPAGLVRLDKPQIVAAGNEIAFQTRYTGTVTQTANVFGTPYTYPTQYVSNVSGGTSNFVPVFHFAFPINPRLVGAFSVTTPFGLATDYNSDTFVRYANTETKLKTIDLSPSFGVKLNDKFSVGAGFDEQRLLANFNSYAGAPAISDPVTASDTYSQNSASDWAAGWHAGLLYQPTNTTRVGLAYHSKFVHHATGYSLFTGALADPELSNPNATLYSGNASATLYLPANTTLSAYHDINNRLAVMGTVIYTQWDIFKQLTLNNLAAIDPTTGALSTTVSAVTPQNFHNTWRVSTGANYKIDQQWLVRAGVGYDQSPVSTEYRNLRLPDASRYAIAFGGRYVATKNVTLDAGWTHEFIKAAEINNTSTVSSQTVALNGHSYSYADVFGLQMTYSFA